MEKLFYGGKISLLGLLAIAIPIALTSCDEQVSSTAMSIDTFQTATVNAIFYAELDHRQLGLEYAPDDTKVIVAVNYNDLNPTAGTGRWLDTLFIQNGMIEADVPVSSAGTNVSFYPDEFISDQIQPHGSNAETIRKVYMVPGSEVILTDVRPGQHRIQEITYVDQALTNNIETVEIRFQAMAVLVDHHEDPDEHEPIPAGTEITLFTGEWAYNTTAGSDGIFEASIPANESIQMEFVTQKTIYPDDETVETRNYRYTTQTPAFQSSTPVLQVMNFGTGTLWE